MALDFVAGCLGGCAGVLVGHPFDTVKVHLQTQDAKRPLYNSTFDCFKKIVTKDSFRGLYRGITSPLSGVAFVNAIAFGVYGNVQRNTNNPESLKSHFIAGSSAGLIQSLVCSPMELAKTRIQLQGDVVGAVKHKGPFQCLAYIQKTEGLKGVYRGLGITAMRDVPGCAGVIVGHPLDTVKVHLQTQDHKKPQYRGITDCLKQIVAKESIGGLFRGMTSPLLSVALVNSIVFGVYGFADRCTEHPESMRSHLIAGSVAGLAQTIVSSPMELVKTRIQLQALSNTTHKLLGPLQCFLHVKSTEGYRGLYKTLSVTAARDVPGFAAYFVSYEMLVNRNSNTTILNTLMAGGIAGTISWAVTFPVDVVKSAIEADGMNGKRLYRGVFDCARKGYQVEGYRFFCRGLASTLLRAFPMNAVCFLIVHYVMLIHEFHLKDVVVKYEQLHESILRFSS